MIIGVPKEIKDHEYRVGLVPSSVRELIHYGHKVLIQKGAGEGADFEDQVYINLGAEIVDSAEAIFERAEMIVKVKEPQPAECRLLREGQTLFTYLHLAADPRLTQALLDSGCIGIAYETVTDSWGGLPLLTPMSEVAGRLSIQAAAHCLEKTQGGKGLLLGGVPGVSPAKVLVLGGGVVGSNAIRMAIGAEAEVTVIDKSLPRLRQLDALYGAKLHTLFATEEAIEQAVLTSDVVVGAVLVPGASAPKLVTSEMVKAMRPGSVMIDVAIDQGGCFETSRPTTHTAPTYLLEGVLHYCVTNMPSLVARTSSAALNNATLPFILALANKGIKQALCEDSHLLNGLNVCLHEVTYPAIVSDTAMRWIPPKEALAKIS